MITLFIADLHLSPEHPELTQALFDYLDYRAAGAHALYILGDLFDYWIGDDAIGEFERSVADKLAEYAGKGTQLYLMHGNRDFLLGQDFATAAGAELIEDPSLIMLGDVPLLLMHGDSLCTDDQEYMAFRAMVRDPQWQRSVLALPIAERLRMAAQLRERSGASNSNKSAEIMDVNPGAVERIMRQCQVRTLIQGHTHRPDVHEFLIDDEVVRRYVVGDWRLDREADVDIGWEVRHDGLTLTLEQFSLSELAYH
ncbi:UDP-2,3-diacylglucosamine diphosphatase [Halotalea alkalilenta]|uniref:UDP-2,3-diacylglucosamine diphosphatase n=1 Tax=Halotalea alkalilenta TaxID=376489 RepID=UPI0005BB85D3|nr:UDP-2,3-diacylglucosamine diphosphatase [Halotalea alkalilenta]